MNSLNLTSSESGVDVAKSDDGNFRDDFRKLAVIGLPILFILGFIALIKSRDHKPRRRQYSMPVQDDQEWSCKIGLAEEKWLDDVYVHRLSRWWEIKIIEFSFCTLLYSLGNLDQQFPAVFYCPSSLSYFAFPKSMLEFCLTLWIGQLTVLNLKLAHNYRKFFAVSIDFLSATIHTPFRLTVSHALFIISKFFDLLRLRLWIFADQINQRWLFTWLHTISFAVPSIFKYPHW